LRDHQERFERLGAGVAAIGLGDRVYAAAFRDEVGIRFPLLVDEKREAYRAAGLRHGTLLQILSPFNAAARSRARASGLRQRRLGRNPFQLGGTFVLGPGGVDRFAHVSRTYGDNARLEDVERALIDGPLV
jgi:hypothetical protein